MMWAVILNTVLALGFLITLLFCIGDVDAAINTPTGFPVIQILYQATRSKAGATTIMCMILFSTMIALFGVFASVSRLTWAFARDNGLPFSDFFSRVSLPASRLRRTLAAYVCSLLIYPGPPDTTHSSQCPGPCYHHLLFDRSNQYR